MNTYSAQILSTLIQNGILTITIQYSSSDGTDIFTENITTSTSQDSDWLNQKITDRLNALNDLVSYNVNTVQSDQVLNSTISIDPNELTLTTTALSINPVTPSLSNQGA